MSAPVPLSTAQADPQASVMVAPVATPYSSNDISIDHFYSLLAEDIVVSNMSYHTRDSSQQNTLLPKSEVSTWVQTKEQLKLLGFVPEQEDPWLRLGMYKMEGPVPSIADINNRVRCATLITQLCLLPHIASTDKEAAQHFVRLLEEGGKQCLQALPRVLRDRKKGTKSSCDWRWMEACPDFVTFLMTTKGREGWKVGLNISNLLEVDMSCLATGMLSLHEARDVYRQLHAAPAVIASALRAAVGTKLILWAPTNFDRLSALMAEIMRVRKDSSHTVCLAFAVPYDPMPGCRSIAVVQELWTHPLLHRKYDAVVKTVEFFEQPMKCVFTGPVRPLHHLKSIALVHVSTEGPPSPHTLVPWKTTLVDRDLGHTIVIDVPFACIDHVHRTIGKIHLIGLLGWDCARRSPAHSPLAPRQSICGYFDPSKVSLLDVSLIVRKLKAALPTEHVFVGSHTLFHEPSSFVLDFGDANDLGRYSDLFQEVLLVSKRRAVFTTMHPKDMWEPILTEHMLEDPGKAVVSIKYRKVLDLPNSVWCKPLVIEQQVAKRKAQQHLASRIPSERPLISLSAHLRVTGLPHVCHDAICNELMLKVSETTQVPLTKCNSDFPAPGEWTICYRPDGTFAQEVLVQLPSDDALTSLLMHVNGSGIRVGGRNLSIEVRSPHPGCGPAGALAKNMLVHGLRGTDGGGQCL